MTSTDRANTSSSSANHASANHVNGASGHAASGHGASASGSSATGVTANGTPANGTRAVSATVPTGSPAGASGSNGSTEHIRVMLIDEHPLFRQGCRSALEASGECTIVAESSESRAGLELAKQITPDVILIDALLSTNDALELARQLRHAMPRVAIIMLTAFEDEEQLFQSMKLGAAAYLMKGINPDELVSAVRRVSQGIYIINDNVLSRPTVASRVLRTFREMTAEEPPEVQPLYTPLSAREIEILDYIAKGNSNKEIAKSLKISDQTVKNHITSILKKLSVNDRTAAVVHALKKGWIKMDSE